MTIAIMGKSGAGKDTVGSILKDSFHVQKIITHTSRPKRTGEKNGIDYIFHTQKEFDEMRSRGEFAESRDYDAEFGHCSYGTAKADICSDEFRFIVITPAGFLNLKKAGVTNLLPVYLKTSDNVRRDRLMVRADAESDPETKDLLKKEINRRIKADNADFSSLDASNIIDDAVNVHVQGVFKDIFVVNTDDKYPSDIAKAINTFGTLYNTKGVTHEVDVPIG